MPIKQLGALLGDNRPQLSTSNINRVSIDSRTVEKGDCFFAICGENFDGHDFVAKAFEKGAACAVVRSDFHSHLPVERIVQVPDTIAALGALANHYRQQLDVKVIAITGSVGKTTTRRMISHVLGDRYRVCQSPKNFNNQIGLPLTLLSAAPDCEAAVLELGTSQPGEIAYLSRIAEPDIAVVTRVCAAHLEGFGSLDAVCKEKLSIAKGLKSNGILIINIDCPELKKAILPDDVCIVRYGTADTADIRAQAIRTEAYRCSFRIDGAKISVPMGGQGGIQNALAAYAVCRQLEIVPQQFADRIKSFKSQAGRHHILQFGDLIVIDDSYNANPASMAHAVEVLSGIEKNAGQRKIFICGDMAELGEHRAQYHRELGKTILQSDIDIVLSVGPLAKIVTETIEGENSSNFETESFTDAPDMCHNLSNLIRPDDIVLVKGSRCNRLEQVVDRLRNVFDLPVSTET